MTDAHAVTIPLLNPNEPEAQVVDLYVEEGKKVSTDDLICTLETTKSTNEVAAEHDGYIVGLNFEEGQSAAAGQVLCYIASNKDWQPPTPKSSGKKAKDLPEGLRISDPALQLAQENELDLTTLPIGPLVTVQMMQTLVEGGSTYIPNLSEPVEPFDKQAILVYGGSGHGKAVIELIQAQGKYQVHGVIDDGLDIEQQVLNVKVIGGATELEELHANEIRLAANAVGGIGDIMSRVRIFNRLAESGYFCPTLIHPTAVVEPSAKLSPGAQVFPLAYIGSNAQIGFGCIINTNAIISHDCIIENYANIAPGAKLAGGVNVGEASLIGMGVTVNLNCQIGKHARIGNSAVIKSDVPEGMVVRAGAIWPE